MTSTKSPRFEKQLEGFCLLLAPLLFGCSTFFWQNGEYGVEAATLIILSMFFWMPALRGLFTLLKDKMPRYAVWGVWIAVFGCISGVCFAFLGYLTTIFHIPHKQYMEVLAKHPVTSQILLFASGPLFPLSILILGINLIYRRSVRLWIGMLFCFAAIAFPLSRIPRIEWMAHVGDILLFIPCGFIGFQLLRNTNTEEFGL